METQPIPGRRPFLKTIATSVAAPSIFTNLVAASNKPSPSNTITLGCIGMGGHGTKYNMKLFLNEPDCRVLAVCDVFRSRANAAAELVDQHYEDGSCKACYDFREILSDPKIDAVVISTPDHWHVPIAKMALAAGKHVFCEKPTYCINEGKELIDAVQSSGKTFQIGLEDRSLTHYHKLVEWERNGAIGDLYHVEVTMPVGSIKPYAPPAPVPDDLNWQMWLGPAPDHPYTKTRTGAMNWRYIRDYSTGMLTDWGAHLMDTAQLAINDPLSCPVEVKAWGHEVPAGSESDIPAVYDVHYRYSNGITAHVKNSVGAEWMGQKATIRLQGSKGWVEVEGWRGKFNASDPAILKQRYSAEQSKHWQMPPSEHRNFLDCIRSGAKTTYPVETLHNLSTTLHLGLISMDLGRSLQWDPSRNRFVNDPSANKRLGRTMREDWKKA
ncbi:MAG: Gfo/Idh/MocA family protein [Puniceicoccaceae bacterium]